FYDRNAYTFQSQKSPTLAAPHSHNSRAERCIGVNAVHRLAIVTLLIFTAVAPASAKKKRPPKGVPGKAQIEAATRLQVFLDRANFCPGKIDRHNNDFTLKALALYRESHGEPSPVPPRSGKKKANAAIDVTGLDLGSVDPVFTSYTVT